MRCGRGWMVARLVKYEHVVRDGDVECAAHGGVNEVVVRHEEHLRRREGGEKCRRSVREASLERAGSGRHSPGARWTRKSRRGVEWRPPAVSRERSHQKLKAARHTPASRV